MRHDEMLTSQTHPLQIHTVTPLGTAGLIGMTLCPGRKGRANMGTWDRDLDIDLEVVRAWKPDLVIALLEDFEFAQNGIPDFRERVAAAGLPWQYAEIRDASAPDERFDRAWAGLGPRARSMLRAGGRVLIHCRAGLGRTGTVAAMLLVDFGDSVEDAITRVRASRSPSAIDFEQEAYLRGYRPLAT